METSRPVDHDVVIVGGGNAGISLAAYLRRTAPQLSVALVAPEAEHRYRPLLSYVGGGLSSERRTRHDQRSLIPKGVSWCRDSVDQVLPGGPDGRHQVRTRSGEALAARDLVLCPGTTIDWDAVPGSFEACHGDHASTNYAPDLAGKTWTMLRDLRRGEAVFVVSGRNTPCPGVGLKPLFLAADHWRRQVRLPDISITLVVEPQQLFGLASVEQTLRSELARLGVTVHLGARVDTIDPSERRLRLTTADGRSLEQDYDALHLAPPHRGHDWLIASGLADRTTTLVANDPSTLEHLEHPGIWALGDAATLDTPTSGGGLRHQVPVVAHNIAARHAGTPYRRYDGYTVAPIPVDRSRLLLAERDRHGNEARSIRWLSPGRATRVMFRFDLHVQPGVYWHRLLRGRGLSD